eukprot:CAMPEP_0118856428 /NCGR_PEP_ID=MMETSP1163-20130328/3906_1 /TAXON_ID=124430 /ORGANISM="Phaeomonas parva, Strain CCMP2877" /LENGTH=131 /DNA_ID=CAMNT_0006789529 /DNA_START=48 /DNA_END=444 /DNA_ORIENTATION=+
MSSEASYVKVSARGQGVPSAELQGRWGVASRGMRRGLGASAHQGYGWDGASNWVWLGLNCPCNDVLLANAAALPCFPYTPLEFTVPEGFQTVLRDFSREVLRSQPEDINAFAFQYFSEKVQSPENAAPENR